MEEVRWKMEEVRGKMEEVRWKMEEWAKSFVQISFDLLVSAKQDLPSNIFPLTSIHIFLLTSSILHQLEVKESSSIFEVKDGPYRPLNEEDILK